MKYLYADRTIFLEDKELLLDMFPDNDDGPYLQNKKTKEKTFITMEDISNFHWIKGKKKWHLKLYRTERQYNIEINKGFKKEIVDGCLCSITSEIIS